MKFYKASCSDEDGSISSFGVHFKKLNRNIEFIFSSWEYRAEGVYLHLGISRRCWLSPSINILRFSAKLLFMYEPLCEGCYDCNGACECGEVD